ncbi:MAG: oxamate carbamoyltransferase subunit AllG family protein [Nitrospiraceae bacterium]
MQALFQEKLHVLNVGLSSFADSIARAGGSVLQIEWAPPAQGQQEIGRTLARLVNLLSVETANQTAFDAYQSAQPVLNGVGTASQVLPNITERMILHSGPPIVWKDMCGPMKGAIVGAVLYEGWAENLARAEAMASSGDIVFEPCHHHNAVGPMAGIISPSMPVWIVTNTTNGNQAFSNFNEGLGKALRFGANGPDVITRLKWMGQVLAPALGAGVKLLGGVDLKPMMAQALHMGDEVHNRNAAASSLFLKRLISALLKTRTSAADIAAVVEFIAGNDHFFLNLSMAACKAMTDAAHGVAGSSMVTAMARNGVEFGIRVSGTGNRWYTAPAPVVDGLFFPGYSAADAAPDLGDSAITETAGVGGFAMAASPAIVKFVGGTPQDAIDNTMAMTHITIGRNNAFTLPSLNFAGSPAGIDVRKVVDTGIQPIINTGIAHREAGIGQIGAGITRAPLACFTQAVSALAKMVSAT